VSATGVKQQRRRQGLKLQVKQVSLTRVSGSSKYFSPKMQAQLYRLFSTPSPQEPATTGQWIMDQSGLSCLWLLWPGKMLHNTELAEGRAQSSGRDFKLFQVFWIIFCYSAELSILGWKKSDEKPLGRGTCWFFAADGEQTCLNDLLFHGIKLRGKERMAFCFRLLFLKSERVVLWCY